MANWSSWGFLWPSEPWVNTWCRLRVGPMSQTWTHFLRNHLSQTVSVDFFMVPTLRFRVLYVFLVLSHTRREVLHFNITEAPSAGWTAQQLREAFPFTSLPKYLLRDRDSIYGLEFQHVAQTLGFEELRIAPRSPWQSPYVERLMRGIAQAGQDRPFSEFFSKGVVNG